MNRYAVVISQFSIVMILGLVSFMGCRGKSNQDLKRLEKSKEEYLDLIISDEELELEAEYAEMLAPILSLKSSDPKTYWFIVSWLKTAYRTPNWEGYKTDGWMATTKKRGIDCSGFSRVMLDQVFDKKVYGGSRGILARYCTPVSLSSLKMGDLVFFKAPNSKKDRIVHVGVYLQDNYFVHATSSKSAARGFGLSVNSLEEKHWAKEFVTGGRVKE